MTNRVLLADHDEAFVAECVRCIAKDGSDVATATSGLECVVQLREFRPHILVLEPALP